MKNSIKKATTLFILAILSAGFLFGVTVTVLKTTREGKHLMWDIRYFIADIDEFYVDAVEVASETPLDEGAFWCKEIRVEYGDGLKTVKITNGYFEKVKMKFDDRGRLTQIKMNDAKTIWIAIVIFAYIIAGFTFVMIVLGINKVFKWLLSRFKTLFQKIVEARE